MGKKNVVTILMLLFTGVLFAQKGINTPYSYYGLGQTRFAGNIENNLMGGISSFADSLRVDVRNPASLGKLLLTTFSAGISSDLRTLQTQTSEEQVKTTVVDYLSLSFPIYKKIGLSFGLTPYSSVGYKLASNQTDVNGVKTYNTFEGNGGINRIYIAAGYEFMKGFRAGLSVYFNFGKTNIENLQKQDNSLYFVQESNSSTYRGMTFTLGTQYERELSKKLKLFSSLYYTPQTDITATNTRVLSTILYSNYSGGLITIDSRSVDLGKDAKNKISLPSHLSFGIGVGEESKWYAGIDYELTNNDEYNNSFVTSTFVSYNKGHKISLGGFFIPQYNSFTSYWKRITYRLGFYYDNLGITLHNQHINDFGITFGASLPVQGFSNITVGGQLGSRGTKSQSLIKENYYGLRIAFTLNDKWFQKSKYN